MAFRSLYLILFFFAVGLAAPAISTAEIPTLIQLPTIEHLQSSSHLVRKVSLSQNFPFAINVPPLTRTRIDLASSKFRTTERMSSANPANWVQGGPCGPTETECMSMKMLQYVNELRAKKSGVALKPFKNGAKLHLKNAMEHSVAMKAKGGIYHQVLKDTDLGCDAFFSGENVALNHNLRGPKDTSGAYLPTDPARMCVEQFINSPPHRKNLENPTHETAVMGVLMADDGYMWCTQTFAMSTRFSDSGTCMRIDGNQEDSSRVPLSPTPSSTPITGVRDNVSRCCGGHKFQNLSFWGQFPDKKIAKFNLKCTPFDCRYCMPDGGCLGEEQSVSIDKRI